MSRRADKIERIPTSVLDARRQRPAAYLTGTLFRNGKRVPFTVYKAPTVPELDANPAYPKRTRTQKMGGAE